MDAFDALDEEARRVDRFYADLPPAQWQAPTRCAGWNRKDLLAHLLGDEEYTRACLDDRVAEYEAQGGGAGYESLNDLLVARRSGDRPEDLLAQWRAMLADNHRRLRERGADAQLATAAGPYPLGRQAWYLACELAIHADDAGVPVTEAERGGRLAWRAAFGLDALGEVHPEVKVDAADTYRVQLDGQSATLDRYAFVEATSGRLAEDPSVPEPVRRALRVLA